MQDVLSAAAEGSEVGGWPFDFAQGKTVLLPQEGFSRLGGAISGRVRPRTRGGFFAEKTEKLLHSVAWMYTLHGLPPR